MLVHHKTLEMDSRLLLLSQAIVAAITLITWGNQLCWQLGWHIKSASSIPKIQWFNLKHCVNTCLERLHPLHLQGEMSQIHSEIQKFLFHMQKAETLAFQTLSKKIPNKNNVKIQCGFIYFPSLQTTSAGFHVKKYNGCVWVWVLNTST